MLSRYPLKIVCLPFHHLGIVLVRVKGLEPPRLAAPEPKSGASASFATPANIKKAPPSYRLCHTFTRVNKDLAPYAHFVSNNSDIFWCFVRESNSRMIGVNDLFYH